MGFKEDLQTGHKAEEYILKELKKFDPSVKRVEGYEKRFDIVGDEASYEVKYDRMSVKTGNVAVEYRCRNKNSGLSTTEADYLAYIYFDGENWVWQLMYAPEFKEALKNSDYKKVNGGDNWESEMLLIPVSAFAKLAYIFPEIIKKST